MPRTLTQVLTEASDMIVRGDLTEYVPIPTGFDPLDGLIGGGLRKTELVLLGGAQGIGKTIATLQMARNVAAELVRVLKPGGGILWYDFRVNNPRNPHVCGQTIAHIRHLFPQLQTDLRTVTLLPPLARRLGRTTGALYPVLARLPWLRTHYIGLIQLQLGEDRFNLQD